MDKKQCNDIETNNTKKENQEKKIEIEPDIIIPPAPVFHRCGADDLNIKPIPVSVDNIVPMKGNETETKK